MNANNSWDHVFNICTKIPSSTSNQGYMPTLKHSGCPDYMLMVLNVGWALIPTPITVMWGWKEEAKDGVNPSESHCCHSTVIEGCRDAVTLPTISGLPPRLLRSSNVY